MKDGPLETSVDLITNEVLEYQGKRTHTNPDNGG